MELPVIVTLTGFADIFCQFRAAADRCEPLADKVVVTSRGADLGALPEKWAAVQGVEPFVFARNANIGIRAAGRRDVVLVNDDVSFLHPSLDLLQKAAYSCPHIGVLSPQFHGLVGSFLQRFSNSIPGLTYTNQRLCFTCVYLKRSVLDVVGELDERFDGYGAEDDDYCHRVRAAGFRLAVTPDVAVKHGFKNLTKATTSYERTHGSGFLAATNRSTARLREKWPGIAV